MLMMENKVIPYPSRGIVEDVLMRSTIADVESFTPFEGLNGMIKEQLQQRSVDVSVYDILQGRRDFDPHAARATEENARAREECAREVRGYYSNLEDVHQSYINKYVNNVLVGFKLDKAKGLREITQEQLMEIPTVYDEETGMGVIATDLEEKETTFSTEEIVTAKLKLPYVLKQLHEESIKMCGSLLSFIIAIERLYDIHREDEYYVITPREVVAMGVYKVDGRGNITLRFDISENTRDPLRNLISWARGNQPQSLGWVAYKNLIQVTNVLDLDIKKENANVYTSSYIDAIVCTYLASNEEYIRSYGYADKNIFESAESDKLCKIIECVSEDTHNRKYGQSTYEILLADSIGINIKYLGMKDKGWQPNPKVVDSFLADYCEILKIPKKGVSDYRIDKGLLQKFDGTYVTINVVSIINEYMSNKVLAVIAPAGYLIVVEEIEGSIRYLGVVEAMRRFRGLSDGKVWGRLYI